jgi:hypothetical protein
LTFRHRAGVSPYTSSFDFAETCVFGKQSLGPFHCGRLGLGDAKSPYLNAAPLLPKLRGHFAEFLFEGSPDRLSILYLPTCVGFGTGTPRLPRGFSRRHGFRNFALAGSASRLRLDARRIYLPDVLRGYPKSTNAWVSLAYPVPPSVITMGTWYRNINRLSIAYAFRPRLRSRLTLSRLALLRNPWAFGGEVSHFSFVTRASILTSQPSTAGFRRRFAGLGTLPYHSVLRRSPWLRFLA